MKNKLLLVLCLALTFILTACFTPSTTPSNDSGNQSGNQGGSGEVIVDEVKTFNYHYYGDDYTEEVSTKTTNLMSASVKVGNNYQTLNRASQNGYDFNGAFSAPNGKGIQYFDANGRLIEGLVLSEGQEIYAYWTVKSYTLVFNADGAKFKEIPCNYGQVYQMFDIAYKDGYVFLGWFSGSKQITNEYGYCLSDTQAVTEKTYDLSKSVITLEAHFEIIKYTVTFDYNGYQPNETIKVEHGKTITSLPNINKEYSDAELLGWSLTPGSSEYYNIKETIRGDLTLYAYMKYFKVFNLIGNGEQIGTLKIYQGETFLASEVNADLPQGYHMTDAYSDANFSGSSKITTITYYLPYDNLYILLEPITYNINYSLGDGETITTENYPTTFNCEISVRLPVVSKEHCIFLGWTKDLESGKTLSYEEAVRLNEFNDVTLYPLFKGENALLHINSTVDGNEFSDLYSEYGKKVKLTVPLDDDYKFAGYYYKDDNGIEIQFTDSEGNGLEQLKTMELSLYAHWNKKHYITVISDPEGLVSVITEDFYVVGDQAVLQAKVPQFYQFVGWSEVDNKGDMGEIISTNLTYRFVLDDQDYKLAAMFKPKEYTVKLNAGEGALCTAKQVIISYNSSFIIPIAAKDGYLFEGWYYGDRKVTNGDGVGEFLWNISDENITLTAKLTESNNGYKLITNLEELTLLQSEPTKNYYLTCNLTVTAWDPADFSGKLNGGGFTISGLTNSLFNHLKGTVMNLTVDVNIESTDNEATDIGGLCRYLEGSGNISYVTATGSIVAYGTAVGGIVGCRNDSGIISNCTNNAIISGKANNVGGIVGNSWGSNFSITNCTNNAAITGNNCIGGIIGYEGSLKQTLRGNINKGKITGVDFVGGVFGRVSCSVDQNANYACTIDKLSNSGEVIGQKYTGGVIGYIKEENVHTYYGAKNIQTNIDKISNTGDVTGTEFVGGLIGYFCQESEGSGHLNNSSSSGQITGTYKIGGLVGWVDNYITLVGCSNSGTEVCATGYYVEDSVYKVYLGGYFGKFDGTIDGCVNSASISYAEAGCFIGGIAGYAYGDILNCSNSGNIYAPKASYVGGIAGRSNPSYNRNLSKLTNSGNITGVDYIGGVFGSSNCSFDANANYTVIYSTLKNTGVIIGAKYVGGISGRISNNNTHTYYGTRNTQTKVERVSNTGNITGEDYVGGLIGYLFQEGDNTGQLIDSSSSATIIAFYRVGGLVGWIDNNVNVTNCSNEGSTVTATSYYTEDSVYKVFLGGYFGRSQGSITGCDNNVEIAYSEKGNYVGGISGSAYGNVSNCSNTANISAPQSSNVGGLFGYMNSSYDRTFSKLTNTGNITGIDYVGGIFGRSYSNFDANSNHTTIYSTLDNSGVIKGAKYVGGISGSISNNNTHTYYGTRNTQMKIERVTNTGDITGETFVGGITGYIHQDPDNTGQLIDSSSCANIIALYKVGGLVGWIDNSVNVGNCSNEGSTVIATSYYTEDSVYKVFIGGYFGKSQGSITGCDNKVKITYEDKGNYVGGITGYMYGDISDCNNTADITATKSSNVGGIAGYVDSSYTRTYARITNTGNIIGVNYIGGLFGRTYSNFDANANYTVTYSTLSNNGKVNGTKYIGGIAGSISNNDWHTYYGTRYTQTKVERVTNTGDITGTDYVGGIFGYLLEDPDASGQLIDSSSSANIVALYRVGGLVGWIDNSVSVANCSNEGSTVTATSYYTEDSVYKVFLGGYFGRAQGNIKTCDNAVELSYNEKGNYIGGIAGYFYGDMSECTNIASISAPKSTYVAGLIGYVDSSYTKTYSSLTNSGNITGADYVAGIFGRSYSNYDANANYTVTYSTINNSGIIKGNRYIGGIAGSISNNDWHTYYGNRYVQTKIERVGNTGNIFGAEFVGGLVGHLYEDPQTTGSLIDSTVKCTIYVPVIDGMNVGNFVGKMENSFSMNNNEEEVNILITSVSQDTISKYFQVDDVLVHLDQLKNLSYNTSLVTANNQLPTGYEAIRKTVDSDYSESGEYLVTYDIKNYNGEVVATVSGKLIIDNILDYVTLEDVTKYLDNYSQFAFDTRLVQLTDNLPDGYKAIRKNADLEHPEKGEYVVSYIIRDQADNDLSEISAKLIIKDIFDYVTIDEVIVYTDNVHTEYNTSLIQVTKNTLPDGYTIERLDEDASYSWERTTDFRFGVYDLDKNLIATPVGKLTIRRIYNYIYGDAKYVFLDKVNNTKYNTSLVSYTSNLPEGYTLVRLTEDYDVTASGKYDVYYQVIKDGEVVYEPSISLIVYDIADYVEIDDVTVYLQDVDKSYNTSLVTITSNTLATLGENYVCEKVTEDYDVSAKSTNEVLFNVYDSAGKTNIVAQIKAYLIVNDLKDYYHATEKTVYVSDDNNSYHTSIHTLENELPDGYYAKRDYPDAFKGTGEYEITYQIRKSSNQDTVGSAYPKLIIKDLYDYLEVEDITLYLDDNHASYSTSLMQIKANNLPEGFTVAREVEDYDVNYEYPVLVYFIVFDENNERIGRVHAIMNVVDIRNSFSVSDNRVFIDSRKSSYTGDAIVPETTLPDGFTYQLKDDTVYSTEGNYEVTYYVLNANSEIVLTRSANLKVIDIYNYVRVDDVTVYLDEEHTSYRTDIVVVTMNNLPDGYTIERTGFLYELSQPGTREITYGIFEGDSYTACAVVVGHLTVLNKE